MTENKSAIGLLGAGYIANFAHLPTLSRLKNGNLVAVCDEDMLQAQMTALRFNIPHVYASLAEMLEKERLDLVDICLPPQKHTEVLLKIIEQSINCLVEKPLTVTTADADKVIALAAKNKVQLNVVHNYSVVPAIQRAKAMVTQGMIGEIVGIHINHFVLPHERYLKPEHWCHELPGEYFSDLVPHLAMLLVEFLGPANRATSVVRKINANRPLRFDELRVIAWTPKGIGTIDCSLNCPSFTTTVDIIGTKGQITTDGDYQTVVLHHAVGHRMSAFSRGVLGVNDIVSRTSALTKTTANVLAGNYRPLTYGHGYLIENCLRALQGEGEYPISTYNARESVHLLELAFEHV
jgi:predicted dehydrogenase